MREKIVQKSCQYKYHFFLDFPKIIKICIFCTNHVKAISLLEACHFHEISCRLKHFYFENHSQEKNRVPIFLWVCIYCNFARKLII